MRHGEAPAPGPADRSAPRRPRLVAASWEEAFAKGAVPVGDGHMRWDGAAGALGTPIVAHAGQVQTVYRLSFRWHHGREPAGNVRPTCSYPHCVAGDHLADGLIRDERARRP